jgi:hypothetical protein
MAGRRSSSDRMRNPAQVASSSLRDSPRSFVRRSSRAGDEQLVDLVQRLCAGLVRAALHRFQRS